MGGVARMGQIMARPNVGEVLLGGFRDTALGGQILRLETEFVDPRPRPEIKPTCEPGWASESGFEFESEPPSHLGDSRAPLVSDREHPCGSFLPCRQKFQEEIDIVETISVDKSFCNFLG